jgi:hypothetical protein
VGCARLALLGLFVALPALAAPRGAGGRDGGVAAAVRRAVELGGAAVAAARDAGAPSRRSPAVAGQSSMDAGAPPGDAEPGEDAVATGDEDETAPGQDDAEPWAPDDDLEARVRALEEALAETRATAAQLEQEAREASEVKVQLSGYLDVGFFWAAGDGSGIRKDYAGQVPGTADLLRSWVFIGDPLSTTVNSRGDVADLGGSRAIHFDPLHASNKPTFLVNALNLGVTGHVGDAVAVHALVDFLPRDAVLTGAAFGDFVDVKLAWLRFQGEFERTRVVFQAGKVDSLLGLEYRAQEASTRLTVTPSLLCRYTCGRPVGLKGQAFFLDGALEVALALTNGSAQVELFPWSNEIDWNGFKTVSGRLLVNLPVGLELSLSGAIGAQDRQRDDSLMQWHVGGAARLTRGAFLVQAEVMGGRAPGKNQAMVPCAAAACLAYVGAYGLFSVKLAHVVSPYLRVDWRSSTMRAGRDYAYASNEVRGTLGVRVQAAQRLLFKAEYTLNRELFGFEFPDDVFTSSAVVTW